MKFNSDNLKKTLILQCERHRSKTRAFNLDTTYNSIIIVGPTVNLQRTQTLKSVDNYMSWTQNKISCTQKMKQKIISDITEETELMKMSQTRINESNQHLPVKCF